MRQRRVTIIFVVLLLGLVFVELRLVRLQLLQSDLWARESLRTTMQFEGLPFERGWILDRHGEPLARTEEVRDLQFRWRRWRRGSALGHVSELLWLLDGERRAMAEVVEGAPLRLVELGSVPIELLGAIEPRPRRRDILTYVGWLYGRELRAALDAALAEGSARLLAELPGWEAGLVAAQQRCLTEAAVLGDLARLAGLRADELYGAVDAAVARADLRVERALLAELPRPDPFERARELHAEFDDDAYDVAAGVGYEVQTLVAVRGRELPGWTVRGERRRVYPAETADVAPLLVGRVGQPRESDLDVATAHRVRLADLAALEDLSAEELHEYEQLRILVREIDYGYGDERGLFGLEAALEPLLRGKRGWIASVRDEQLDDERAVESARPMRGLNVSLTLDLHLQRAAEQVLDGVLERGVTDEDDRGWPGAIVLLDPRTGHVLAAATSPRPRRAALALDYGALLADPRGPLHDRALGAGSTGNLPPPGSTFKPIAALAALGSGAIGTGTRLSCDGRLTVGTQSLGCLGRHGEIGLRSALARSCNLFFYRVADRAGGESLAEAARLFGFGRATGLLEGNEALARLGLPLGGSLSDPELPLPTGPFARSEAMRLAIGQAPLDDVTPLQVAVAFGALGVGYLRPPSLVAAVEGYGEVPPRAALELPFRDEHLVAVRAGLAAVVDDGAGTAHELLSLTRGAPLAHELARSVAGKTGTPEVAARPDHSWFAGYLPREEPVLAFAIFLEHTGEHGGDACVPLLAELLRAPRVQDRLLAGTGP